MRWRLVEVRNQRVEFVIRASRGESLSGLCREYGISRPTGYLWLKRFRESGVAGVEELSRRPHLSQMRTAAEIEARIVALRRQHPDWGARKLAVLLEQEGLALPVITVHRVLLRHDLVPAREGRRQALCRFEREQPNQLWQTDFKGQKGTGAATGPLSVLDDHSRYLVALEQTSTTRSEVVRERLEGAFRMSGLPEALLMDHGGAVVERALRQRLDAVDGVADEAGRALHFFRCAPPADAEQGGAIPWFAGTRTQQSGCRTMADARLAG